MCGEFPATVNCPTCVLDLCDGEGTNLCNADMHATASTKNHPRFPITGSPTKAAAAPASRSSNVSFEQSMHLSECDLCGEPAPVVFECVQCQMNNEPDLSTSGCSKVNVSGRRVLLISLIASSKLRLKTDRDPTDFRTSPGRRPA